MKNKIFVACLASCLSCGVALILGMRPVSAATNQVRFSTRENGVAIPTVCKFVGSSEEDTTTDCPATYGSYDSVTNTLTLSAGINNLPNGYVSIYGMDDVTITADSNIQSALGSSVGNAILDLKNYSFTEVPYKSSDNSTDLFQRFVVFESRNKKREN